MRLFPAVAVSLLCLTNALFLQVLEQFGVFQSHLQLPIVSDSFVKSSKAPLLGPNQVDNEDPCRFIVILKDELTSDQVSAFKSHFLLLYAASTKDMRVKPEEPDFFQVHTVNGFSSFLSASLLDATRSDPRVLFVETDRITQFAATPRALEIQKHSTWGLDRISHRKNSDNNPKEYLHDPKGGAGVDVYVLDSGIDVEHPQFEGRATWGKAIVFPQVKYDYHGHGTHVAGIIGSSKYGVCKKVNLISVAVANPWGTAPFRDSIKGIEFAYVSHKAKREAGVDGFKGLVINISNFGEANASMDKLVNAAVGAGIHVVVSAGNVGGDACLGSPARASGPITVGAIALDDTFAAFSNWGKCVDVFAPGVGIESTYTWSDYTDMSGTLMATGFVSSIVAYFVSLAPKGADVSPVSVKERLLNFATKGVIKNLANDGSPNLLAYNGAGGDLADFWEL